MEQVLITRASNSISSIFNVILPSTPHSIIPTRVNFRDKREWQQFHDPRNWSLAISIEAAERKSFYIGRKTRKLSR